MQRILIMIVLILFGALSTVAVWHHGYWGIVAPLLRNTAGGQVLADLAIALALASVWMWHDAKAAGRSAWPWIGLTVVLGSFGPLLYLLTRSFRQSAVSPPPDPRVPA